MLEYFPDPYPDELLYSVWARFSERVRYLNRVEVLQELFGKKWGGSATIEWTCSLEHLIKQLSPGHCYTAESLINQHTLFPFYAPFQPPERARALREQMAEGDGRAMYMRMGILTSHLIDYLWLRYCPICLEAHRERFGEAYWHRLHQAPGVETCPVHDVFLEDSNLYRSAARERFTSAEEAARSIPPRSAVEAPYYTLLKDIAESISELLSTCFPSPGANFIHEQYFALLDHRGFVTTNGRMRVVEFLKAFTEYYPSSFLSLLHCELSHTHSIVAEWAARLPYSRRTQHPLHHLLVVRFLGARIHDFLSKPISPLRPFG